MYHKNMFNNLRNRLIFSHILPLVIIIPLMGLALISVFESQIYLPSLASSLESNAYYLADILNRSEPVWSSPILAQSLLEQSIQAQSELSNTARLMLLTPDGRLLASTDRGDLTHLGALLNLANLETVQKGRSISQVLYNTQTDAEVIDVMVPVVSPRGEFLGVVRMTYHYATFADEFNQVRTLISGLLLVGLVLGSILGYLLGVSISRPIRQVTRAVNELATSSQMDTVRVSGPDEVVSLGRSFNILVTRLRQLEESRRQLLANLVHELGRPLGALLSAIQALSDGAEQDPVLYHELVDGMNQETDRLQHLLTELASLHEQVLGTLELNRQKIDLTEWLPVSLRTWQEAAREKRLRWQVTLDKSLATIVADPVRLGQIIGNLVSNAIKFTPSGGEVTITAASEDGQVMICVADNGPGMSVEEQAKIFTPFYRGAHGRRFPQGMGLGLSIARDLVTAHGGKMEVNSAPGAGSRFTIWLPKE